MPGGFSSPRSATVARPDSSGNAQINSIDLDSPPIRLHLATRLNSANAPTAGPTVQLTGLTPSNTAPSPATLLRPHHGGYSTRTQQQRTRYPYPRAHTHLSISENIRSPTPPPPTPFVGRGTQERVNQWLAAHWPNNRSNVSADLHARLLKVLAGQNDPGPCARPTPPQPITAAQAYVDPYAS